MKTGTPAAIVARLNDAVNRSLAAAAAQTTLEQLSLEISPAPAALPMIDRLAHVEVD